MTASEKFAEAAAEIAREWMAQDANMTAEQAINGAVRFITERAATERPDFIMAIGREKGWV